MKLLLLCEEKHAQAFQDNYYSYGWMAAMANTASYRATTRDACMFLSNLMFSLAMGGSGSSIRLSCNSLISSS